MKKTFVFLSLLVASITLQAQTPILFRPDAGSNDSTDDGSQGRGKDAFVYEAEPTVNYGIQNIMQALAVSNCNQSHSIAYIRFDLATLPAHADTAFVVFNHMPDTNVCLSGCSADFYFASVTEQWYEQTINYANKPAHDAAFYGPVNISFPNNFGERAYDITGMYNAWRSGAIPNYGMSIYSTDVNCNNIPVFFGVHTSDDANADLRPYLKIYYSVPTAVNDAAQGMGFRCYPNPANDVVRMEFVLRGPQTVRWTIRDLTGRSLCHGSEIMQQGLNRLSIPMDGLAPGLYTYTVSTDEGAASGKIGKE